ncbi:MAG: hypothetical protein IMZ57_08190 [Acidobacteria bacterium]|nr:hypothetical protein [Acidobacteriota bacterium]
MKKIRKGMIGLILAAAAMLSSQDAAELRTLLVNRTDETHKAIGIIIGLVDAAGQEVIARGTTAPGGSSSRMPTRSSRSGPSPRFLRPSCSRTWWSGAS